MKILYLFSTTLLLINSSFFFLQRQESPELKEAEDLTSAVVKLFNQQKFDEALPLAKRSLQIREKLLPRADPRVSSSLLNLGELYLAKRDFDAAKSIFERLLAILEERFGPTDLNLAVTLDRLAVVYHSNGDMRKAEDMYQRAIGVREKAFGPESVRLAEPLFSLAQFYRYRKDFKRASSTYKRTLSIYARTSGITTAEFERASDGFRCLAYESNNNAPSNELEEIRKQVSPTALPSERPQIINGKAISLATPEYPPEARARALSGIVVVLVEIDEAGNVIDAGDMCQGLPYLTEAAMKAARKSRFTPTKISGMPAKVKGIIQYNFVPQWK